MVGIVAGKKLYDAAAKGDVSTFDSLLQEDPDLLDNVSFTCSNRTPLHVATLHGNAEIVESVLRRNPQLAEELDARKSSPLHVAAAKGYVGIASRMLSEAPNMCWARDYQGMNPIHVAAMNGHVEILEELLRLDPSPAREKVGRGQTVLHLCVKLRQLGALEFLVTKLGDNLVRTGDDDGETLLHLAAAYSDHEMINYLVQLDKIDKKCRNSKGETPLQILDGGSPDTTPPEIRQLLTCEEEDDEQATKDSLVKLTDVVIVVAILIATMAFQGIVSPPGGVWQEDSSLHKAGEAVMASNRPKLYKHFINANAVAFSSSLITIILLTAPLSLHNSNTTMITICTTWISMASIAISYGAAVLVITPNMEKKSLNPLICTVAFVSYFTFGAIYGLHEAFSKWWPIEEDDDLGPLEKFVIELARGQLEFRWPWRRGLAPRRV